MINRENQTVLSTTEKRQGAPGSANGEILRRWHRSAPAKVRRAFQSGDDSLGWTAWTQYLARRRQPKPLRKLVAGKTDPLDWALPDHLGFHSIRDRLVAIGKLSPDCQASDSVEQELQEWLSSPSEPPTLAYAFEALAWAHALPELVRCASQPTWWALLDHLCATTREAESAAGNGDPLVWQLLAGELPLVLAYLLPEIAPCRHLFGPARETLSAGLEDLLDGEGFPAGSHLTIFRPLMACWTRCRAIGGKGRKSPFRPGAEDQFRWAVRAALRLTRRDGTQVLSGGSAGLWCRDLFDNLLQFGGDKADYRIADLTLPGAKNKVKRTAETRLPQAATHSEWSAITILRAGWGRKEPRLTAVYPAKTVDVEFGCGSDLVWSGPWTLDVRWDGEPLLPQTDWEEVCWHTDRDADYLELEVSLGEKARVQRHLLLAKEDRFLMVADAILGVGRGKIDYCGSLPLSEGVRFEPAAEGREGRLLGKKPRALVLPLALPEWRCDPRGGSLTATAQGLELSQSTEGSAIFAPLFFDLDARRMRRPFTWRQLTLAENLTILPGDAAVGYRVMVGKRQWLIYRTLRETGNRTVLGHNLVSQMLVARFNTDGEVDSLLEIE